MSVTKLVREYTTERRAVVAKRRVRLKAAGYYSPHTEAAQMRRWSEDSVVEITIDVEALCKQLAARAIHTKTGKSTTFHGIIKAKVTQRVEHNVKLEDMPLQDGYEIVEPKKET